MEKLTHFLWTKIVAMILCIFCTFGAIGILFIFALSANFNEGEFLDLLYQSAADNYSAAIVDHYEREPQKYKDQALSMFSDTSFAYAVVESNKQILPDLDTRNWGTYLYGTPEIAKDYKYHFVSARSDAKGRYEYNTSSILSGIDAGDFIYYEAAEAIGVEEAIIQDVVFVKDSGLFYVVTDEMYLLVYNLVMEYSKVEEEGNYYSFSCFYRDDFGKPYYVDSENRIVQIEPNPISRVYLSGCDQQLQFANEVMELSEETENLPQVWNNRDIHVIETLPEEAAVYPLEYNEIQGSIVSYYLMEDEGGVTYYHVLSYVQPDVVCRGDLFDQARQMNNIISLITKYGIAFEVVFVILAIASFAFLMNAAGKRRGDQEIHLHFWDRLPFEIYTVFVCAVELALFLGGCIFIDEMENDFLLIHLILLLIQGAAVLGCIAILYCMGVAVRIKSKNFWKYTVIHQIYQWLKRSGNKLKLKIDRLFLNFHENPSLLKKTILFLGVCFILEFFSMIFFYAFGYRYTDELFSVVVWLVLSFGIKAGILIAVIFQMDQLRRGAERIANGDFEHPIDTSKMMWEIKKHGDNLNAVGDGISLAVAKQMKSEHFKTELITNVSHDIKTPLTSIINYVDLLEKEEIDSEKAKEYIEVLDRQSNRLKKLIEDLMEASKASTGNLAVNLEKLEADVFLVQTVGEFEEKVKAAGLDLIIKKPEESITVLADSRHFWRVIDNLMSNICKYAQPDTRVYIDLEKRKEKVYVTFKNTSKTQLNISSEELMERFVRGDESRNTEGNGLGLNIARSLMELMKGELSLVVDGDLFKVILTFNS